MNETPASPAPIRKKIFVVDDEPDFTSLIKRALESTGEFEVQTENVPSRALAAAVQFNPDLILLDVIMPGIDGGTLGARLKSVPALKDKPVLFLTATISPREAGKTGLASAGNVFLAKPVDLDTLINQINSMLAPSAAA